MASSDFDYFMQDEDPAATTATAPATTTATAPATTTATAPAAADSVTYEKDYLPAQRSYFKELSQDPSLSPLMRTRLLQTGTQLAQKSFMQRAELDKTGMDIKQRQIQFDTAKFSLDQAREDAARKRNMFGELAKLQEQLLPVLKDSTLDFNDKKSLLGQKGVEWAGIAALNPAVANALNSANASLSAQPKNRVTKLDYFNKGADPKFLADYETSIGRSLGADEEVPIDIYGPALYAASEQKKQEELKTRIDYNRAQDEAQARQAGINKLVGVALKAKLAKPTMGQPSTEFDEPASKAALTTLTEQFGTPEEKKKFKAANVAEQITIGQGIANGFLSGKRLAQPPKPSTTTSLFTSPSK